MRALTLRQLAARSQPVSVKRHATPASIAHWKHHSSHFYAAHNHLAASSGSVGGGSSSIANSSSSNSMLPPELADYRPNVGVCLVNRQGFVFAATRVDDPGKSWQMPQGGIDPGEEALTAAVRELQEETSISSVKLLAEAPRWLAYDFPSAWVRARLSSYWAPYKGQAQRWFLFEFTGHDSEVDLATSHREFSEWRWMPLEQLPQAVVPFKKPVYEEVLAEFGQAVQAVKHSYNSRL